MIIIFFVYFGIPNRWSSHYWNQDLLYITHKEWLAHVSHMHKSTKSKEETAESVGA